MVQTSLLNGPYGTNAATSMTPSVPATAFASLSNGFSNTAAAQMMMTPSGQMFSSLPAGFSENLANFKVALPSEQSGNSNLLISNSPSLIKEEISALQLTPLSFASTPTVNSVVNGGVKIESLNESSYNLSTTSEPNNTSKDITSLSEVCIRLRLNQLLT